MARRIIRTAEDMLSWTRFLNSTNTDALPVTVSMKKGADRSVDQNALAFKWCQEVADQREDMDASDVRADCKLNIGVKMLHAENEDFREQWNRLIRGRFKYEELLLLMVPPHDYPVTRIMTVKQMSRYLDAIYKRYTEQGVVLTLPPPLEVR